ncbi:MAG: alpha-galactosidase [Pseudomonadales bacterium]|jgi:alpha-galactosidase|nr:alpha-galactosidase [Pseudomonadales bacterium]
MEFLLCGGTDDRVALCLAADAERGARVLWFGDWPDCETAAAPAPASRQRWGARLDDAPLATLCPGAGTGWPAAPALEFLRADGRWRFEAGHVVAEPGAEPGSLRVLQTDAAAELALETHFQLDPDDGSLRVAATLANDGTDAVDLRWLAVLALPLPHWCGEVIETRGDWCAEFQREVRPLGSSSWLRETREGRSSHRAHPGVLLAEAGADARRGRVLGVQFAWSGDHRMRIDALPDGRHVLQVGVLLHPGELRVEAGERHRTPDLWLACSGRGLDGVTARMHALQRRHVRPARGQRQPRPVHLNTWEAVYFDHDPEALGRLADCAAALGVERFVLDDGWFLGRTDDARALGDWSVDPARYPDGLTPLIDRVRALGMEFGLWVEPEMINDDSELARAHPEWIRGAGEGRTGRSQRVLDLTLAPVREHLFAAVDALLRAHPIGYLKWDHNRTLTETAADGSAGHYGQTLGLYALLDRLRAAHPAVEIESCASGGGRADLGMLARCHRVWVSDCNDPVLRARIMAGASPFLPPEVAGCHVGPARAHTTGRVTDLDLRAAVALWGAFGLELDVRELTAVESGRLAAWIALYKRWREVLACGHLSTQVPDGDHLVRVVTALDRSRALLVVVRTDDAAPGRPVRFALPDLDPRRRYRVQRAGPDPEPALRPAALAAGGPWSGPGTEVGGAWLVSAGLQLQLPAPQRAVVFEVTS